MASYWSAASATQLSSSMIEHALAVEVALTRLERTFHDPHPVQLPPHVLGIDVVGGQRGLQVLGVHELVAVIRDVHLLLADELPVEAVQRAVEHESVGIGRRSRGAGVRRVVRQVGRELHAALPRQVLPGAARLRDGVHRVDRHQRFAGAAGRARVVELQLEVRIRFLGDGVRSLRVVDRELVGEVARGGHRGHAGGIHVPVLVLLVVRRPSIDGEMVPHRFGAGLRDRERNARQHALDA